jgi:hypothetical protein
MLKNQKLTIFTFKWPLLGKKTVKNSSYQYFSYYGCKEDNCERALNDPDIEKMNAKLNNAPAQFLGNIVRFKSGEHQAMCTRNNNFSNRAQKTDITVV